MSSQTTALAQRPIAMKAIVPQNVQELMALGDMFYKGGLCPKMVTRGEGAAAIIAFGLEIGIMPAAALSSIHLTGGKATIWGQMPLALVRKSGLLESHKEWIEGEGEERTAVFQCKRIGEDQREYRYSVVMARKAGAFGKGSSKDKQMPWDWDTDNMLKYKARNRLLSDVFGDVLNGLVCAEAEDNQEADATPTEVKVTSTTTNSEPASAQPPTQVDGIAMIEESQLFDVKRFKQHWFTKNNIDTADEEAAFTAWQEFLKAKYGVETATKLTYDQAENLLALLIECDPHPLNAMLAGQPAESTAASPQADGQPATTAA